MITKRLNLAIFKKLKNKNFMTKNIKKKSFFGFKNKKKFLNGVVLKFNKDLAVKI